MAKHQRIENLTALSESLEEFNDSKDVYILFLDLCDSTEFKQFCLDSGIPDSIWIFRQHTFLSRTAKLIKHYKGNIVKTIGDEIMAYFANDISPISIINCCQEVFKGFKNLKSYNTGKFIIKSKASIDFGTCYNGQIITPNQFDPIGRSVDRCARISKFAEADSIVFSSDFKSVLDEKNPKVNLKLETLQETLKGLGKISFFKISTFEESNGA